MSLRRLKNLLTRCVSGSVHASSATMLLAAAGAVCAAPPVSDDFNTPGLDGATWTFVDPLGDGEAIVFGEGTGNALLLLTVPSGPSHDAWVGGNDMPRVMQPVDDADFEVQVRFESSVDLAYQVQGLSIEQDAGNFLRVDVYSDGSTTRVFAASIIAGVGTTELDVPITSASEHHVRLGRVGDNWTVHHSIDGTSWGLIGTFTSVLAVSQTGVTVGNYAPTGDAPAHTAIVDYFFNTAAPVVPEDGNVGDPVLPAIEMVSSNVTSSTAEITWITNVASNSEVDYGLTAVYELGTIADAGLTSEHSIDVTGLDPDTQYFFAVRSTTADLDTAFQDGFSFTTSVNQAPVADAGFDQTLTDADQDLSEDVSLDGSGSTDDTGISTYEWFDDATLIATGVGPTINLPIGDHVLTLLVTDVNGATGTDDVVIRVVERSTLESHDFNMNNLDPGVWAWTDPLGDSAFGTTGVGTSDAQLHIAVPAGVEHQLFGPSPDAPRVMQATNDSDFEVEFKADNLLADGQNQGLVAWQDEDTYVRFDFYALGGVTHVFAASFVGGAIQFSADLPISAGAPLFMRVTRDKGEWTQQYSYDGVAWAQATQFHDGGAIAVQSVGVFAGNFGESAPAHTAMFDYFFNTADPIVPEDGKAGPDVIGPTIYATTATAAFDSCLVEFRTDELATGQVSWGLTASYELGTATLSIADTTHAALLQSLTAETTYFFEIVMDDAAGNPSFTTGQFTTAAAPIDNPPIASAGPDQVRSDLDLDGQESITLDGSASTDDNGISNLEWYDAENALVASGPSPTVDLPLGDHTLTLVVTDTGGQQAIDTVRIIVLGASTIESDDFNSVVLNQLLWDFVNPLFDSAVVTSGAGTGDAHLEIQVPGGEEHNPFNFFNAAPRIMQDIDDTDFQIEVRFDSDLEEQYQIQGVLVEQDADNYQRFDFFSDGSSNWIYAASYFGGIQMQRSKTQVPPGAPFFMRVIRTGDQWIQSYSKDGVSWIEHIAFNDAINVTRAGVFAGNAGFDAPPMTARVDYFFDAATPVDPEDDATPMPPEISNVEIVAGIDHATVSWTTNEPASGTVAYGETTDYELGEVQDPQFLFAHSIELQSLERDTLHHVRITSTDLDGLSSSTGDLTFTTQEAGSDLPPVADAGPDVIDQDVDGDGQQVVLLDGSGSTDDVAIVSYEWRLGPTLLAVGASNSVLLPIGDHSVELTVTDTIGQIDTDVIEISVTTLEPSRVTDGLQVLYDFNEGSGSQVLDVSGSGTPLDLTIANPKAVNWTDGGLELLAGTIIDSGGPATKVIDACQVTNEVTVEAWIRPSVADQGGPARIVTMSSGALARNFTLSHGHPTGGLDDMLDMRLRTSATDNNGLPSLTSPDNVIGDELVHVVYTRAANGDVMLYVNKAAVASGVRGGDLSTWDAAMTLALGNEQELDKPWLGEFHLVAVYDRALAPQEVVQNFNVGAGSFVIEDIDLVVDTNAAIISWETAIDADSYVEYGLTEDLELGFVGQDILEMSHAVTLNGLQPNTTYSYRIVSTSQAGEEVSTSILTFTTLDPNGTDGPKVDVWYGTNQAFGTVGIPQTWINILGNVSDLDDVASLTYRHNGGPEVPLTLGPDTRRLQDTGDFNIDVLYDDLADGLNEFTITAIDGLGRETVEVVSVPYSPAAEWPSPYLINWQNVGNVNDVAQVVDGFWTIEQDGLRSFLPGYDRLVAIGDVLWEDYEITVSIRMDEIDPRGYQFPSNSPAIGLGARWTGHLVWGPQQPAFGYEGFGALALFRFSDAAEDDCGGPGRLEIFEHPFDLAAADGITDIDILDGGCEQLEFHVWYVWKLRVQTTPDGQRYSLKVWERGTPEPPKWRLVAVDPDPDAPLSGSILLLSHHIDSTFSNVQITPGPFNDGPRIKPWTSNSGPPRR